VSKIHHMGAAQGNPSTDVIFVHGLGGDWRKTWAADSTREDTYWPKWLVADMPAAEIWSLEYEANRSNWRVGMSLIEHADQILEILLTNGFGRRPILFVAHSLGGLLVKSLLRSSCDAPDENAKQIALATRGIVFIATAQLKARASIEHPGGGADRKTA
jgi:triacylglycerol esterase/lipase EstA (alpha/beta hydrolase family)